MLQHQRRHILAAVALTAVALCLSPVAGGGQEGEQVDGKSAAEPSVDRYAVPEGNVAELLGFINGLKDYRPTSLNDHLEHQQKSRTALKAAAEKILKLEKNKLSAAYKTAVGVLLEVRAQGIGEAEPAAQRALLADLKSHFAAKKDLGMDDVGLALNSARAIEYSGRPGLAPAAYSGFGEVFAKAANPQIAEFGELFAGAARRLTLKGKKMKLSGVRVDGSPFDLASLKDKVVLVDFWATWCGPCIAEFPNIKKYYELYHDRGFEVVGVSLDQDRAALEKYLAEKEVPWITLHDKESGGRHPATTYYGIFGIPMMILVDREGKVVSLSARGAELGKLLEQQLGPAEAANAANRN
jgi:thiol-disulfide isomerase/thioredoxin